MDDFQDAGEGKVFVVLRVPQPIASQFQVPDPHVTVAYAGEGDVELWERVSLVVADELGVRWSDIGRESWRKAELSYNCKPVEGTTVRLAGVGYFDREDGSRVAWSGVLVDDAVTELQRRLVTRLEADLGQPLEHADPWVPHATLGEVSAGETWTGAAPTGDWMLASVEVWNGPDRRMVIGDGKVLRFERGRAGWVGARRAGKKPVDGTFPTFEEALAVVQAAEVTAQLEGHYDRADQAPAAKRTAAPAVHTLSRNVQWRWRVDTAELHPPEQLPSGWWAFDATCAAAGNTQVYIEDGREVVEYRPRDVIFDPRSLASALGNPWELLHSPALLTLDTAMHKARGCILDYGEHPNGENTRGTLIAWDRTLLDSILLPEGSEEYGLCRELSMAFRAGTIDEPGTTDDGVRFDRRTAIVINNSIASVPRGRAKTARPGLPRADALPSRSDVEWVTHADALLQIARAGRLPSKPIYFARAPWRAQKDSTVTPATIVEAILQASGKTTADLATALGITEEEVAAMLAAELSAGDLERIAAALVGEGSGAARPPMGEVDAKGGAGMQMPEMVSVDIEGATFPVPKPVADLIDKLRAATSSATMRADKATKEATKAVADAAAKYEGAVTREQADALVQSEATAVAELIDATRRLRGAAFSPTPRMDAENKALPLRRRDWEQAVLLAFYGDEEGATRVAQLDAKSTEAARRERFDDFMHEIRKGIAAAASKVSEVRAAITSSSRALADAAAAGTNNADAAFDAAQKAAVQRAAGQPAPATN